MCLILRQDSRPNGLLQLDFSNTEIRKLIDMKTTKEISIRDTEIEHRVAVERQSCFLLFFNDRLGLIW